MQLTAQRSLLSTPYSNHQLTSLLLVSGLLGLGAPKLLLRLRLDRSLGSADGAGTGNCGLAKVATVARLSSLVGNGLVDPKNRLSAWCSWLIWYL